jgi:hypothetical protein
MFQDAYTGWLEIYNGAAYRALQAWSCGEAATMIRFCAALCLGSPFVFFNS